MKHETYQRWLGSRESYRYLLYGDEGGLIPVPPGGMTAPSMAELASNEKGGRLRTAEAYAESEVNEAVYNILARHDEMASRRVGKGVFSLIDPDDLPYIASLTAGTVVRWERACQHQGVPSPFEDLIVERVRAKDFERADVQLVVEAASVAMEMVQLGFGTSRKADGPPAGLLMNFIARHGPHFASSWANGDTIREYCEARKLDPEPYLALLGRQGLIYYALNNARSPLDAAVGFVNRFHKDLSIDNLSAELGWESSKVKAVFTLSTRKELARTNPRAPLTAARRVAHHIDVTLATENLAAECGVSTEVADDIFLWSDRLRLALRKDPMAMARRVAKNYKFLSTENLSMVLGWSEVDVDELFTVSTRHRLAQYAGDLPTHVKGRARVFKEDLSVQNIARRLGWSEARTAGIFTLSVRRNIAMGNIRNPLARVKEVAIVQNALAERYTDLPANLIAILSTVLSRDSAFYAAGLAQQEQFNNPRGIGRGVWLWTVARHLRATRAEWVKTASEHMLYLGFVSPSSINSRVTEDGSLSDYEVPVAGFEEDLFSDQASDFLQRLALKAGVSYAQLEGILKEYATEDHTLTPAMEATLRSLQVAARQSGLAGSSASLPPQTSKCT